MEIFLLRTTELVCSLCWKELEGVSTVPRFWRPCHQAQYSPSSLPQVKASGPGDKQKCKDLDETLCWIGLYLFPWFSSVATLTPAGSVPTLASRHNFRVPNR
jgi:hypothetical protein